MSDAAAGGFKLSKTGIIYIVAVLAAIVLAFMGTKTDQGIRIAGDVPFAFVLFVLILLGVAFFHHYTMWVALAGVLVVTTYTATLCPGFHWSPEQPVKSLWGHFTHEGEVTLLNLGALLLGFALLAKFFERSNAPDNLPRMLPKHPLWSGFVLLAIVWFISSFLDNIAAAIIGGVMAKAVYKGRVTVGFVAAIVAASNAGGAWSVVGDTTTTMMWLDGVNPLDVAHGIVSSVVALVVVGLLASWQQNKHQEIVPDPDFKPKPVDKVQLFIVGLILVAAIAANYMFNNAWAGFFAGGPWYGVWAAILVGALLRRPAWEEIPGAAKGAVFLLSLVWCASLMPVDALYPASWQTAFGLGFVSAVFDNIPLTKLALEQGGYDWGALAFTVGFGGSMIWFGSSAGVAISKDFPEARNTGRYIKEGWFVPLAYVVAFAAFMGVMGFHPHAPHRKGPAAQPSIEAPNK